MAQKCRECGLVNWDHVSSCKRCNASLSRETPSAYNWYVVYCIFMALMYFLTAAMGIFLMFAEPDKDMSQMEANIMSAMMLLFGLLFGAAYVAAPLLPRRSWAWIYGLVMICIGLTSLCCLPACIPLLLAWMKPEMKEFFGRTRVTIPPLPPQWS